MKDSWNWLAYILAALLVVMAVFTFVMSSKAAQTATTTGPDYIYTGQGSRGGWTQYIQHVMTASAANEQACADVRGFSHCTVKADVSGTINVDLDWNLTSTYDANFVVDEQADITADTLLNPVVDGMYLCYDMDACTTCTLTLTIYCTGLGTK